MTKRRRRGDESAEPNGPKGNGPPRWLLRLYTQILDAGMTEPPLGQVLGQSSMTFSICEPALPGFPWHLHIFECVREIKGGVRDGERVQLGYAIDVMAVLTVLRAKGLERIAMSFDCRPGRPETVSSERFPPNLKIDVTIRGRPLTLFLEAQPPDDASVCYTLNEAGEVVSCTHDSEPPGETS